MPKHPKGGQSILIKTGGGGVEMNFSHFGGRGDNIVLLHFTWFGGIKFCQSNFLSWGRHCFEKKFAMHAHFISDFTVREGAKNTPKGVVCKIRGGVVLGTFPYLYFKSIILKNVSFKLLWEDAKFGGET